MRIIKKKKKKGKKEKEGGEGDLDTRKHYFILGSHLSSTFLLALGSTFLLITICHKYEELYNLLLNITKD